MTGTYVAVLAAGLAIILIAWMIESWQKWDDERRNDRQWILWQIRQDRESLERTENWLIERSDENVASS